MPKILGLVWQRQKDNHKLRVPGAIALHSRSIGIGSEALSQITKQNEERDFETISNV